MNPNNIIENIRAYFEDERGNVYELSRNPFTDFPHFTTPPKTKTIKDHIDRIIHCGPATIIFWDDGTKTVAKCDPRDAENKSIGVLVCVMKYLCRKAGVKYSDVTKFHH